MEFYRAISILCSFSKVFEKLLYQRMINFCERYQLFTSEFGFRSQKLCADAITTIGVHEIDKKFRGQACFIDLPKAFDKLDRYNLLLKLSEYGFSGEVNNLRRSYSGERVQYISISGERTSFQKLKLACHKGQF